MKERKDASRGSSGNTETLVVRRRPLSKQEAESFMSEMRTSQTITGYSLSEWTGRRDTFVALNRDTGEILGTALVHHFYGGWSEIAVLYVREPHRGKGLGTVILHECIATIRGSHPRILLFFCEPAMQYIAERAGFSIHANAQSFSAGSFRRRIFIRFFYQMQWRANAYRLREIRRKRNRYGCAFTFHLGAIYG